MRADRPRGPERGFQAVPRDLPQRARQGGWVDARSFRRRQRQRARRGRREDDPQAARRHDAAAGARRARTTALDGLVDARSRARIDAAAALNPNPGRRTFQRLNRAEYAAAVRDLLGLDVDVAAFLPPDTISHGFDNIADVQSFSPTLLEGYLRAAARSAGSRSATRKRRRPRRPTRCRARPSQLRARRGRAVRHARRHLGRPHLPGRRRVHVPDDAALDPDRAAVRQQLSRASRSRSRSTASASRCSTSTRG